MTPADMLVRGEEAFALGQKEAAGLWLAAYALSKHILIPSLEVGKQYSVQWLCRRAETVPLEEVPQGGVGSIRNVTEYP
jgi:hypothetical protein